LQSAKPQFRAARVAGAKLPEREGMVADGRVLVILHGGTPELP
jgi:hypothetical protein